jgi:hypothetical protein
MSLSLSPRILLASAWLICGGGWLFWSSITQSIWWGSTLGLLSAIGGIGSLLKWKWSQWCVYFVAVTIVSVWTYYLVLAIRLGKFPYETMQLTVLGLVPGFVVLSATIWSADIVRRRFRLVHEQV